MVFAFITALFFVGVVLFVWISPQFGGRHTPEKQKKIQKSSQFIDGAFRNAITPKRSAMKLSTLYAFFFDRSNVPAVPLPIERRSGGEFMRGEDATVRVVWFGHSTILLEIEGKKIFIDPMLGSTAGPHSAIGPGRFSSDLPLALEAIPVLDAVLISHDHYDHLDYGSIQALRERVLHFYVPLGLGAHLTEWGVEQDAITELDWWEEVDFDGITLASTPGQHFSGRGFTDGNATLWSSWVIQGRDQSVFFSGDSGYDAQIFTSIGEKYGPFDLAMVECGQYDDQWPDVHMTPEQTVQASKDLRSELTMPIHWGAFRLALHQWDDPVERFVAHAKKEGMRVTTPRIGEFVVPGEQEPTERWWKDLE